MKSYCMYDISDLAEHASDVRLLTTTLNLDQGDELIRSTMAFQ